MTASDARRQSLRHVHLPMPPSRAYAMGMPETIRWTRDRVINLPADGNRYELVDGELVVSPAPAPAHQAVLSALYEALGPYVRSTGLGRVLWAPADLELEPGQVNQPNLFVLPSIAFERWDESPRPPVLRASPQAENYPHSNRGKVSPRLPCSIIELRGHILLQL